MVANDRFFIREAYRLAAHSPDPSTQNGAILVDDNGVIMASGCNCFPRGVPEYAERLNDRDTKLLFIEHAERNAIYQAARVGIRTKDLTMYCPWFACENCARAIIQSGIKRVVGHNLPQHKERPDWEKFIKTAMIMLGEAGVKMDFVEGEIGDVEIRFAGKKVRP